MDVLLWVFGEHREEITLGTVIMGLEGTLIELHGSQALVESVHLEAPPPQPPPPPNSVLISQKYQEDILEDLSGWDRGGVLMLSTYGSYSDRANDEIAAAIVIARIETELSVVCGTLRGGPQTKLSGGKESCCLNNSDDIFASRKISHTRTKEKDMKRNNGNYSEESMEAIAAALLDMY
jgi:hypothetical protein